MADLRTTYMGVELANPIVVGACSLSKRIDTIKKIEAAGAGGLVLKSLFEEQVQLEMAEFEQQLGQYDALYAEAVNLFPNLEYGGPKEHIYWIAQARKAVQMPLFASLNAMNDDVWIDYARQLAETGVDGLELNFYSLPLSLEVSSAEIEKKELEVFARIRDAVKIPLAVKLHPYYTSMFNVAGEFSRLGANSVVLFNRLWQPDIDIENEEESAQLVLSSSSDAQTSLRWTGLLYKQIEAEIVANTGIMDGPDVVKAILAGATSVQVVSTLYKNKLTHVRDMVDELSAWMDGKGYKDLAAFRGKLAKHNRKDPWSFERAQYIKALLGFD